MCSGWLTAAASIAPGDRRPRFTTAQGDGKGDAQYLMSSRRLASRPTRDLAGSITCRANL